MKKHQGPEPPKEFYNELVGKKYLDVEFKAFSSEGEEGETKKLSDYILDGTSRAWAIVFFTTWCPWSPPTINQMKVFSKGKDIMLIALCVDEDSEKMKDFVKRHKRYLFNGFKCLGYCKNDFQKYRVKHVPHIVMLNRKKDVIRNYIVELCENDKDSYDIEKIFEEALQ